MNTSRFLAVLAVIIAPALLGQTDAADDAGTRAGAGADIHGIVSDSATGERIVGANVVIAGTNRGAATNVSGFYLVTSIPAGLYEIVVSAVGYERRSVPLHVTDNTPLAFNIKLPQRVIQTGEVVVRSGEMSKLTERAASVHVMTPREMQSLPSVAQSDLLRSLQMLPGITSTSDVSTKFFVRGGAGDQNLILLDGMRIYNPYHAFGVFSILDPDIIRSTEVYTGAFPAGFGGRLSSVVNVITRDGNLSRVSGNASINFLSGKLEVEGPFSEDNSWLVSTRSSLFSNTVDRLVPNPSPFSFYDLFFKGTMGTSTGRVGVRGFVSGDDVTPADPAQPDHRWRNAAFSAVLSGMADDRTYFDASLSYSYATNSRDPKEASSVRPASSRLEELSMRVDLTSFTESQNTFYEGFEISFPSIADSIYTNNVYPNSYRDSHVNWYAWVRYEGKWGDLGFDLGLHSDLMMLFTGTKLEQIVQPRITFSYDLGQTWIAKASYGIFTQDLITISNEDDLITLFDAWVFLPENLRPEIAYHYVVGAEGNLFPSLALSVQGYAKDFTSLALYNTLKVTRENPDYIRGTGEAYGAEALVRFASPFIDLFASYALSHVTVSANGATYAPRYDRHHTVKAVATLHLFEGCDVSVRWEYGSGYPFTQSNGLYDRLLLPDLDTDPFPGGASSVFRALGTKNAMRLPAYYRWDGGVTYRFAVGMVRGTAGVSVINFTDHKNILYYDRNTGKTDYMIPFFPTASLSVEF